MKIKNRRGSEEIGTLLAGTVQAQILKSRSVDHPRLAVKSTTVYALKQKFTPEQAAQAAKDMALIGTGQLPFLKEVEACKIMDLQQRPGSTVSLEVQVFRLSREVAIVTLPGEVFVELGLAIKRASPFRTTLVVELANDDPDYLPTKKAFSEGSYEVLNSRIEPGGGEMMVDAAVRMLKELAE